MPPEYNWMAEAKEPSMGKRGSRGTHTQIHKHIKKKEEEGKKKKTASLTHKRVGLVPCFAPYSAQCISAHPLVLHGGMVV